MKPFLISSLTIIILVFSELLFAQQLHVVYLDQTAYDYVNPLVLTVQPGDQIKFVTTGGSFKITIPNANNIFVGTPGILKFNLDSNHPQSQIYQVRYDDVEINQTYQVYCITTGGGPTAPPRIIITTQ